MLCTLLKTTITLPITGRAQNWEPPKSNWTKAPLYDLIPHNLEEHPLHLRFNNTPVNGVQLLSLFTPTRGSTDMHLVYIRYVNSVPFVVMFWCGSYMKPSPSDCNVLEDGFRYLRVFKNNNYLEVSCNGGPYLLYNLNVCPELKKENVAWIQLKDEFGVVYYETHNRGEYLRWPRK